LRLAIVSLIVLVLLGALAGLILTRVFGAAAARNQKRPGGGEDKGGRDLMGDDAEAKKARGRMSRSLG
jgi:flagellar basal body-associated protein FliL